MTVVGSWLMWSPPGHSDPFSLSTVSPQEVLLLGLFCSRYKPLHFPLLNFRVSQLVQFSLGCISHSHQFCLISRLAEGTLCPTILILLNTTVHSITPLDALLATGLHHDLIAHISTPCLPLWAALHPSDWLVIQPMGDCFIEVQVKNTTCSPLIYQASLFNRKTSCYSSFTSHLWIHVWLCLCALFCSFSCTVMTGNFNYPFILKMPMACSSGIFLRREL